MFDCVTLHINLSVYYMHMTLCPFKRNPSISDVAYQKDAKESVLIKSVKQVAKPVMMDEFYFALSKHVHCS